MGHYVSKGFDSQFGHTDTSDMTQEDVNKALSELSLGASGTNVNQIPAGALPSAVSPNIISQARTLADAIYGDKESKPNMALASLLYFADMGEKASQPGATLFGSAASAFKSPAAYLLQVKEQQQKRDQAKASLVGSLIPALKPTKTPTTGKQYKIVKENEDGSVEVVNESIPFTFPELQIYQAQNPNHIITPIKEDTQYKPTTLYEVKDGKIINEIIANTKSEEDALLAKKDEENGKIWTKVKPIDDTTLDLKAYGVADTDKLEEDYPNIKISKNGNVLLTKKQASELMGKGLLVEAFGKQIANMDKEQFEALDNLQGDLKPKIKAINEISRAFDNIKGFYDGSMAVQDYGMAVGFAKILDPTSVARESEVQSVATAGSVVGALKAQIMNALLGTGKLSESMRKQIFNSTVDIYVNKLKRETPEFNKYKELSNQILQDTGWDWVGRGFKLDKIDDIAGLKVEITAEEQTQINKQLESGSSSSYVTITEQSLVDVGDQFLQELLQFANKPNSFLIDDSGLKIIGAEIEKRKANKQWTL